MPKIIVRYSPTAGETEAEAQASARVLLEAEKAKVAAISFARDPSWHTEDGVLVATLPYQTVSDTDEVVREEPVPVEEPAPEPVEEPVKPKKTLFQKRKKA